MAYRKLAKDTLIYGGADFLGKIISFITFPIIANILNPRDFGALEVLLVTSSLIGLFINCGISNGVQRYYWEISEEKIKRQVLVSSGFFVIILLSLIFFILSLFFLVLTNIIKISMPFNLNFLSFFFFVFFTILMQLNSFLLDIFRINFQAVKFFIISSVYKVSLALLSVFLIYFYKSIEGYLASQFLVSSLVFLIIVYLQRRYYVLRVNSLWIKKLIKFGYPFIFMGLGYWVFTYTDRWMLAYLSSLEEVGIYSVAFRFGTIISFINIAFGTAWSPWAFKIKSEYPNNYQVIYGNILLTYLFFILLIGTFLMLFADDIIRLIMSKDYWKSSLSLKVLSLGLVFQATQQITALGISLESKTYIFSKLAWLTAILNAILNYFLIPKLGALGASIATSICHILLTSIYLRKTIEFGHIKVDFGKIFILLVVLTILFTISLIINTSEKSLNFLFLKLILFLLPISYAYYILPVKGTKFIREKLLIRK